MPRQEVLVRNEFPVRGRILPLLLILSIIFGGAGTCGNNSTDSDGDGYTSIDDCDDANPDIHPDAEERCNDVDDDCDGAVDEGLTVSFYLDLDGDGFGVDPLLEDCAFPDSSATVNGDCDDANPEIYPDAEERCNDLDDDCDGDVDEGLAVTFYLDMDGDGFGTDSLLEDCALPEGYATVNGDCDDANPEAYPGAEEVCDGADNDCDGEAEEGHVACYADEDGDGYGSPENIVCADDCPKGYTNSGTDCDDTDWRVHPSSANSMPTRDTCDGRDNDCDGKVDEDGPYSRIYRDEDGDGHGDPTRVALIACLDTIPAGYVTVDFADCDDANPDVNPDQTELCNGLDDDCDGMIDEDLPRYYADQDEDGYGDESSGTCDEAPGTVEIRGDCCDADPAFHPGAEDPPDDGLDQDCGGTDGSDPHVGINADSFSTLADALGAAEAWSTIWVGPGTYAEYDLTFAGKPVHLRSTDGASTTVIDAQQAGRIFVFDSNEDAGTVVDGFTLTGGETDGLGGAMFIKNASPTIRDCVFTYNQAKTGGAVYSEAGAPSFERCQFFRNYAEPACTTYVDSSNDCEFYYSYECEANTGNGGAVFLQQGEAHFVDCLFKWNSAHDVDVTTGYDTCFDDDITTTDIQGNGGAISAFRAELEIEACRLEGNSAGLGGAVYLANSTAGFTSSSFIKNRAEVQYELNRYEDDTTTETSNALTGGGDGGALHAVSSTVRMSTVRAVENESDVSGGTFYLGSSTTSLDHVQVIQGTGDTYFEGRHSSYCGLNYSDSASYEKGGFGGGIRISGGSLTMSQVIVSGCSAHEGGGIYSSSNARITANYLWLAGNLAEDTADVFSYYSGYNYDESNRIGEDGKGGGLRLASGTNVTSLKHVVFIGNLAKARDETGYMGSGGMGGSVSFDYATAQLVHAIIVGNAAEDMSPSGRTEWYQGGTAEGIAGLAGVGSSVSVVNSIFSDNTGTDLSCDIQVTPDITYSDFSSAEIDRYCLNVTDPPNLTAAPAFLAYDDWGFPSDLHLALTSPLIDAGDPAREDTDGTTSDMGTFGGAGEGWDLDGDGYPNYFWPGTWANAPAGFNSSDYDCNDSSPGVHLCL